MVLPEVERAVVENALRRFDTDLRAQKEWSGWENSAAQKYALVHNGLRYPPKKIISMATGVPVSKFSGGGQSNEYLQTRGFEIVVIDHAESGPLKAPSFLVGKVYDRWPDINVPYGGSRQSGISSSGRTAAIFLFTGDTGEQYGYRDTFDADGVFSYTGEGQVGDMQLTKGNLSIANHARDGRALHVFESLGKGTGQKYIGEFTYVNHSFRRGPDRKGNDRQIIVFHLVPVSGEVEDELTEINNLELLPRVQVAFHPRQALQQLARRALRQQCGMRLQPVVGVQTFSISLKLEKSVFPINFAKLQNCKTAKLQNCKTAKLQNCKTAKLQNCKTPTSLFNSTKNKRQLGVTDCFGSGPACRLWQKDSL